LLFCLSVCLSDLFLPTRCRYTGLLLHLITLNDIHTHTHTHGRNPLDEGSARHRNLYLTTHNTYKRRTSTPPARIEPAIPASKRRQTHALDRAASVSVFVPIPKWISCPTINRRVIKGCQIQVSRHYHSIA